VPTKAQDDDDMRVNCETAFPSLGRETWGLVDAGKAQDEEGGDGDVAELKGVLVSEPEEVLHVTDSD